jgi:hypothetical protein
MSILVISLFIALLILLYLVNDYFGPRKILLKETSAFGSTCLSAENLIVQEFDNSGNLWATRGMIIYRLLKGATEFTRIAHLSAGPSVYWLNNFSIFRSLTNKPECIEITVSGTGKICAFSAGYMWFSDTSGKKFIRTLQLPHYGIRVGRGILGNGLLKADESTIFFGEYFRNEEKTNVTIYSSNDFGQTWEAVFKFQPGKIRHIHALQKDPYTDKIWICTGDDNNESMIGWSYDNFNTIAIIGQGSQVWRTCHLVFTEESIYWGTDTGSENISCIYRWDKHSKELHKLLSVDGAVFYGTRLFNGIVVMSTDREGFPNEKDDKTRLYVIKANDKISIIECGTWKHKKHGFRFGFAKLRFQRNQGSEFLVINALNIKEIPDADLIILSDQNVSHMEKFY